MLKIVLQHASPSTCQPKILPIDGTVAVGRPAGCPGNMRQPIGMRRDRLHDLLVDETFSQGEARHSGHGARATNKERTP